MQNFEEIINKVYQYYPKHLAFDSKEYQSSIEYLSLLRKREIARKDIKYIEYLTNTIRKIFDSYEVVNWTDLSNCNDYEYRILLHKNQAILDDDTNLLLTLGGKRLDLFLFISAIEKYYYFYTNVTEYQIDSNEWYFKIKYSHPEYLNNEIIDLRLFLTSEAYCELSTNIVKKTIYDVESELKPFGSVSVFDCFFTDIISI